MRDLASRLTRAGNYVSIGRYTGTGYYEVTKEIKGHFITKLFDSGQDAWRYYRHNREEVNA